MIKRLSYLAVMVAALVVTIACEANAPGNNSSQTSPASAQSGAPAAKPAAPAAQAATPAGPEPANVAEIFPAGQGRDVVLNNCGSCHNLACSAIGQRTAARWDSLRDSHKDKITDADAVAAFTYLKSHFNDANPEPKVPAKFLQGGCTPF